MDSQGIPVCPKFDEFPRTSTKSEYLAARAKDPAEVVSWHELYGVTKPGRFEAARALMLGQSRGLPIGWDHSKALAKHKENLLR